MAQPANNVPYVPRLIALHAADYGGKDTAGALIEQICAPVPTWIKFRSRAFATKMKESVAASLGVPVEKGVEFCDHLKQDGAWVTVQYNDGRWNLERKIPGRVFIRDFATKGHREIFDPDFWVNILLPIEQDRRGDKDWHANFEHAATCVITDLRFNSEADRVRELGGEIWSLIGRGEPFDTKHLSNGDFEWETADQVLDNSGGLGHLESELRTVLF